MSGNGSVLIFRNEADMLTGVAFRTAAGAFQDMTDEHGRIVDIYRDCQCRSVDGAIAKFELVAEICSAMPPVRRR